MLTQRVPKCCAGGKRAGPAYSQQSRRSSPRTVTIRGEPHTVLQALNRQVAHYAYHIGQIVFLAKHFRSGDWKSLSIPRGKSEDYNRKPLSERKPGPSGPRAG